MIWSFHIIGHEQKKIIKRYIVLMCERIKIEIEIKVEIETERERKRNINMDCRLINSSFYQFTTFALYNEAIITLQGFAHKIPLRHHCAAWWAKRSRNVRSRSGSDRASFYPPAAGIPARGSTGVGERERERETAATGLVGTEER